MSEDAFESIVTLPNQDLIDEAKTLIGFDGRYARIKTDLTLLADPEGVSTWAKREYKKPVPIVDRIKDRYPLFVMEGDVGTGKTAFVKCAASKLCSDLDRE